jgi:hypothetical protein
MAAFAYNGTQILSEETALPRTLYDISRQTGNTQLAIAVLRLLAHRGCGLQFVKFAIDREITDKGVDAWYQGQSLAKTFIQELLMLHRGTYLVDNITQLSFEIVRNGVILDVCHCSQCAVSTHKAQSNSVLRVWLMPSVVAGWRIDIDQICQRCFPCI